MIHVGRFFGFLFSIEPTALLLAAAFAARDALSGGVFGAADSLLRWVLLVGMVLVHELGHALVARRYDKGEIHIVLATLGGYTVTRTRPRPWWGLAMVMAGPATGFLLGALAFAAASLLGPDTLVGAYARVLGGLSVFWSAFNLLPMFPLDGGQALYHALRLRWSDERALTAAARVGVALAVAVIGLALVTGQIFFAIIAGIALMQSVPLAKIFS